MRESLDVMTRDAVDGYEEYLYALRDGMDSLVEETGRVASFLDGHDDNRFTRKLQGFLERMAQNAIEVSQRIYEDIVEVFLRGLETKNEHVGSQAQEDYIQELRAAAIQLLDLQSYRNCELVSGGSPFTSDDEEEFLTARIVGLIDSWDDRVAGLKAKAEALQGSMTQDEMSGTFLPISEALERMVDDITDSVDEAGYHLLGISDQYGARKQQFAQGAEEGSNSVQNAMRSMLGDALDDLTNIVF